jgi:hypothetical protein
MREVEAVRLQRLFDTESLDQDIPDDLLGHARGARPRISAKGPLHRFVPTTTR